jgi:hypothetical protein
MLQNKSIVPYILDDRFDIILEQFRNIKKEYANIILYDWSEDVHKVAYSKGQVRLQVIKEIDIVIDRVLWIAKKELASISSPAWDEKRAELSKKLETFKTILV